MAEALGPDDLVVDKDDAGEADETDVLHALSNGGVEGVGSLLGKSQVGHEGVDEEQGTGASPLRPSFSELQQFARAMWAGRFVTLSEILLSKVKVGFGNSSESLVQ